MVLELISRLKSIGITIDVLGGRLRVTPASLITLDLDLEIKKHKSEIIQELELSDSKNRGKDSSSLTELFAVLKDFSCYEWSRDQRLAMSDTYTPQARWLIQNENANKSHVLEQLAYLCFANTLWYSDGIPATDNEARQIKKALGDCYGNGAHLRNDLRGQPSESE